MSSEDYQLRDDSICGILQDGRTISRSIETYVVRGAILTWYCQIGFPKLNIIDAIIDLNIRSTDPKTTIYGITDKTITRHVSEGYPVVGFTVGYIPSGITVAGTTMVVEGVCIGW